MSVWVAAQAVIASAATVTALGVLARWGPVRWVFRRLISDPFRDWFRHEIREVVSEELDGRPIMNGEGIATVRKIRSDVDEIKALVTALINGDRGA